MHKIDNIYYDIQINNFESKGTQKQQLRFTETRNRPILSDSGSYNLSIVRFQLDSYSLPSFIADIQTAPNIDVNKMIESVTLEYVLGGNKINSGQVYLTWQPTNKHEAVPTLAHPLDASNEYYWGNSFRHYIDLVNVALLQATENLKILASLPNLKEPKMIWDESNLTCSIMGTNEYYNSNLTDKVNIYFNRALYGKLTSLPAYKNFNGNEGMVYNIYMYDDLGTKIVDIETAPTVFTQYIKTSQEYSTISNWSPVSSIVFTTASLPIIGTVMSEPHIYNNGISISSQDQNTALIISDMATNDLCYKPNLIYVPSAEYRYISMIGTNDINTVDVNVYWKDKKGNLIPFILQSGASASIKFLFKLK